MDPAGGSSYAAVSMAINVTPSARERETADGGVLADDFDVPVQGREVPSELVFNQFWEPGDTDHELLDTAFNGSGGAGSQNISDTVSFRLTYPHDGTATSSVAPIDEFSGWIKRLAPATVEVNGTYRREVVIQRTTDITRGTRTIS